MWDKNKAGKRVRYVEAEGLQVKTGKMSNDYCYQKTYHRESLVVFARRDLVICTRQKGPNISIL